MNSWEEGETILLMLKSSCTEITGGGRPGPWGMAWSIPHTHGHGWAGDRQVAVPGEVSAVKISPSHLREFFFHPMFICASRNVSIGSKLTASFSSIYPLFFFLNLIFSSETGEPLLAASHLTLYHSHRMCFCISKTS